MTAAEAIPRVLYITRKWPPAVGGMETYSAALTRRLLPLCELSVRALPGRNNGSPPRLHRLLLFFCSAAWFLLRRAKHFDVIHLGDIVLWPLALAARRGGGRARLFLSAHGTDIALPLRTGLGPRCYALFLRLGAACAGRWGVIANSAATAGLCRAAGFRVTAVVPLGVETPAAAAELPAPSPYVLFVGRLIRRKGCRWFIENVLPALDPALTLVVAGPEWDRSESAALRHERVDFRGPVFGDELRMLRQNALVVIVPNIACDGRDFEGFGLTAVETAADQGVLLAARIDGIVDAVDDGVTGFLLQPEQPGDWAAKIGEIATWTAQQRRLFLERARERVRAHFTWDRVAQMTLEAYRLPLESGAGPNPERGSALLRIAGALRRAIDGERLARLKGPALAAAIAVFGVGFILSLQQLPADLSGLDPGFLLLSALVGVPAGIVLNAVETRLGAALAGARFGWLQATHIGLLSSAANMLPLPGGALVRIGALKLAGASLLVGGIATTLIAATGLGLALAFAGAAIVGAHPAVGIPFLASGVIVTAACTIALFQVRRSWQLVVIALMAKTAAIGVGLIRTYWGLAALGTAISFSELSVFAAADVAGSVVSIVPAGLGINETVAALLAPLVAVPPAVAFIAVGMNRLIALPVLAAATALVAVWRRGETRDGGRASS